MCNTDFEIIEQEFMDISNYSRKLVFINTSNNYTRNNNSIGFRCEHIKVNTYNSIFDSLTYENRFTYQLIDLSLISLYYKFDDTGKLIYHSLAYLPSYKNDLETNIDAIIEYEYDDDEDSMIIQKRVNGYLRIDFDSQGYEEYYHSYTHLHIGFSDYIRLPINHYIKPKEFLWFILKYIYKQSDVELEKIQPTLRDDTNLTSNELKKVFLSFYQVK